MKSSTIIQGSIHDTIQVQLSFFGVFRDYVQTDLNFCLSAQAPVQTLKAQIIAKLQELNPDLSQEKAVSLVAQSALADESGVMGLQDQLRDGMRLALLPPVCGG